VHRAEHLRVDPVRDVVGLAHALGAQDGHERRQRVGHRPSEPQPRALGHAGLQLAGRPAHERQGAVEEGGVLQAEADVEVARGAQGGDRVGRLVDRDVARAQLVEVVDEHEDEELLLRADVPVDQRLVDPDRARHVVDRGLRGAARLEESARGGDEVALAVGAGADGSGRGHLDAECKRWLHFCSP
jgi:hypothetical protein